MTTTLPTRPTRSPRGGLELHYLFMSNKTLILFCWTRLENNYMTTASAFIINNMLKS